jgi:four helix bundle protein
MRGNVETAVKQFQTFEELEAYKFAREFRKGMYRVTRHLPDFEKYEMASQIRRAALSLTNNIAEGHGRFHFLDQIKFMLQARGSLQELLDDLNACVDEAYLSGPEVAKLKQEGYHVLKLLNGYLRWLRQRRLVQSGELHEDAVSYGDADQELEEWLSTLALQPCNPVTVS